MQHDALLPQPPGGLAPGAAMALLVHVGLLAALTVAVDWRTKTPDVVSAELWSAVPQVAAPQAETAPPPGPTPAPPAPRPAPTPAPAPAPQAAPPPDPQIAVQQARREKQQKELRAEQEREKEREKERERDRERDRLQKDQDNKADADRLRREAQRREAELQRADEARLAQQREDNLKRMLGQVPGNAPSTGTAARDAGPSAAYAGKLVKAIKDNLRFPSTIEGNPAAEVEVTATPTGSIIARRLVRSSGVKEYDDAVLRAIDRTARLPPDTDGRVPPLITITFRPNE